MINNNHNWGIQFESPSLIDHTRKKSAWRLFGYFVCINLRKYFGEIGAIQKYPRKLKFDPETAKLSWCY
jgi:hypothetical protein